MMNLLRGWRLVDVCD